MFQSFILAGALLASAESTTARQFDLDCTQTSEQLDEHAATKPELAFFHFALVLDLDSRRYCINFPTQYSMRDVPCASTSAISEISPYRLVLDLGGSGGGGGRRTINRETGAYLMDMTTTHPGGSVRFRTYATCVPAPYTGLPPAKF